MDTDQPDEDLVARYVANDDDEAFKLLLDRYIVKVSRIAASILGTRLASDVDDVVQDVFVRVHRGLGSFRGESKLSTWIYRIAYNQSITHKKRGLFRLAGLKVEVGSEAFSREGDPSQSMDNPLLREVLDRAIDRLPAEYQIVVRLHYWFDMPLADIAADMGSPENTIKSWLHRARRLLAYDLKKRAHFL